MLLDTSVVIAALEMGVPHHGACRVFCDRLVQDRSRIVMSQILRIEFAQAWFRLPTTIYLQQEDIRRFRLGAWNRRSAVREEWMAYGSEQLERFLNRFAAVIEVPIEASLIGTSIELMARYRLKSHDAIHVATALAAGLPDFASVDSDFRRVPALRLHLLRDEES